jgi:hypothetical protein
MERFERKKEKSAKALKTYKDNKDDNDIVEKFGRWLIDVDKKSTRTANDYCINVRSFFRWEEARRPLDFEANRMLDFLALKPVPFPSPLPWDQSHPFLDTSMRPPRCNASPHYLANRLLAFLRFLYFELEADRNKFDLPQPLKALTPLPSNTSPRSDTRSGSWARTRPRRCCGSAQK